VTPDHLHASVLFAALEAGAKGIFCDKPLSIDLDEADRMVAAAKALGVPLSINYGRRWYPEYVEARRLIHDGAIGNLVQVLIESGGPRAMLWRIHTHAIDLINFFAESEPTWVWSDLEPGMEDYGTAYRGDGGRDASKEPGVNAYIAFENGVRGYLSGWKRTPQDMVVHLIGSEARIELDVEGWRLIRSPVNSDRAPTAGLGNPSTVPVVPHYNVSGMSAAIRELIHAMETGQPTSSTGEMARRTVAITEAILKSAAQGNVRVPVRRPPAV